ncbi:MAG: ribosomal protection-like ABC-F family protein [bacterium]|jgi:ATP-binding cassette subfamily F protein 3
MLSIALHEVHKYYGERHVLKGVCFEIFEGEKVGLLGPNGSGKTTLCNILSGAEKCDSGSVALSGTAEIGVLSQIPDYPDDYTGQDVLYTAFERLLEMKAEMGKIEKHLEAEADPAMLRRYGTLQAEFEAGGGYAIDSTVAKVCNGLGIGERMRAGRFRRLSGGEKTKINLGKLLLQDANILLLDEPTNHLDIGAAEWLEEYLRQCRKTLLIISHDRYFLDRTVNRIIDLENGRAELYAGGYTAYVQEKEARFLQKLAQYEKEANKKKQLEEAARRMHEWAKQADNPSLHRRAFAIEKRISRLGNTPKPVKAKTLAAEFNDGDRPGQDVVVLEGVRKAFGNRLILDGVSLTVRRGDRIALIGGNGSGKTTLLRLINGELSPDAGIVKRGESVRTAYLPQEIGFTKPECSLLDTLREEVRISEGEARKRLARFHFTGDAVFKTVRSLSGGEKSRLKLCLLMQAEINFLLLDEPTNHLDTAAREWIEEAVAQFDGTLFFVSHDRYFIDRLATGIVELAAGQAVVYRGPYRDYRTWSAKPQEKDEAVVKPAGKKVVEQRAATAEKKAVFTDALEKGITDLEDRIKTVEAAMEAAAADYLRLSELLTVRTKLSHELDELYAAWAAEQE